MSTTDDRTPAAESAMLPPDQLRANYDRAMQRLRGDYLQQRWLASPTKRRHYRQTGASLRWARQFLRPGAMLEVGCGPAVWTPLFQDLATSLTLMDISDEMLAGARRALGERPGLSFRRGDFTEAELEPEVYDSVVSIRAYEYMPRKDETMKRFATVLKPGGTLLLVTKNAGWRDHRRAQASAREKQPEEVSDTVRMQAGVTGWRALAELARNAGFTTVRVYPVVIGSYDGWAQTWPALVAFDLIHRASYRRPMRDGLDRLTESVLVLATRP